VGRAVRERDGCASRGPRSRAASSERSVGAATGAKLECDTRRYAKGASARLRAGRSEAGPGPNPARTPLPSAISCTFRAQDRIRALGGLFKAPGFTQRALERKPARERTRRRCDYNRKHVFHVCPCTPTPVGLTAAPAEQTPGPREPAASSEPGAATTPGRDWPGVDSRAHTRARTSARRQQASALRRPTNATAPAAARVADLWLAPRGTVRSLCRLVAAAGGRGVAKRRTREGEK